MFSDTLVRICTAEDGFIIFKMTFLVIRCAAITSFIFIFLKRGVQTTVYAYSKKSLHILYCKFCKLYDCGI